MSVKLEGAGKIVMERLMEAGEIRSGKLGNEGNHVGIFFKILVWNLWKLLLVNSGQRKAGK